MHKIHVLIALLLGIGCAQSEPKPGSALGKGNDTTTNIVADKAALNENHFTIVVDSLSKEESAFLKQLSKENEFLLTQGRVERYYASGNEANALPMYSKIIAPKEILLAKGYVYFELTATGRITDANLVYSYSLGQASTGSGSVIGTDAADYVHTIKSCGTTACIIQVFQNGVKIFEKDK